MMRTVETGGSRRNAFCKIIVFACIAIALDLMYFCAQSRLLSGEMQPRYGQSTKYKYTASFEGPVCSEVHRVVFLKTHKTGSTTTASIFQRFGMKRNLTFLVPDHRHILSEKDTFKTSKIGEPTSQKWNFSIGYQMLTNHIRYNRTEMDKVFHNATYVTVVRNPVAQFESGFYYFEMDRYLPKSKDPIELYMSNPMKYYNYVQQKYPGKENRMLNMQLYDLGMNPVDMYRMDVVDQNIKQLDKDFSLIMINEYFDESLVLLRKLLCWKMTDITYMSRGIRSASFRRNMTDSLRSKILQWNSGDAKLYDYFNKTFWEKVRNYDGDFKADLESFQKHQKFVDKCIAGVNQSNNDKRVVTLNFVKNAPNWCYDYNMGDISWSEKTCVRMRTLGIPQYKTGFYKSSTVTRKVVVKKKKFVSPSIKHPVTKFQDGMKTNDGNSDTIKLSGQKSSLQSIPKVHPAVDIKANQTMIENVSKKDNKMIPKQHLIEETKKTLKAKPSDGKSRVVHKKKIIVVKKVRRPKKT